MTSCLLQTAPDIQTVCIIFLLMIIRLMALGYNLYFSSAYYSTSFYIL